MRKRFFVVAALMVISAAAAAVVTQRAAPPPSVASGGIVARASDITASGFIEADQVSIAAEFAGKIRDLAVQEGDPVRAGQVMAVLDDALLQKQIDQAQSVIEVARASLALVKAGAREEEIRQKRVALAQSETLRDGAKTAWDNALAIRDNPQDINSRVVAARGQLDIADRNAEAAKQVWDNAVKDYGASLREAGAALNAAGLQVDQARLNVDLAEELKTALLPPITAENWIRPPFGVQNSLQYDLNVFQWQLAQQSLAVAQANREIAQSRLDKLAATHALVDVTRKQYEAAVTARDAAKNVLDDLLGTRQNPLILKSQADAAEAAYRQSLAAIDVARAALDTILAAPLREQVAFAEAQVRQAESSLQVLQAQKEKLTVTSPVNGAVSQKSAQKGEIVLPGVSFLKIVNLETLTLKVFIPETQIGQLKLGSAARVAVDSYPDREFPGRVTFISPQAEFTPKDIQTKEERTKTVFAVKITIANPEGILKPGMPADATID